MKHSIIIITIALLVSACSQHMAAQRSLASVSVDALAAVRVELERAYVNDMVNSWECGDSPECHTIFDVDDRWDPAFDAWEAAAIAHDHWADAIDAGDAAEAERMQRATVGATCVAAALADVEIPGLCGASK